MKIQEALKMDDKLEIEVNLFNEMMDVLYELYKSSEREDRNGIVKSRCMLYEYFRKKWEDNDENK